MKKDLSQGIVLSIIGIILGLLFMFFANDILKLFLVIFGIIIVIMSLPSLFIALNSGLNNSSSVVLFILSLINVIFGCLLIFIDNNVLFIIAGIWIIIEPMYQIIRCKNKKVIAKSNLSTLIIGAILILLGITKSFGFFAYLVGGVFVALSIINLIYYLIIYFKDQKERKDNEALDA